MEALCTSVAPASRAPSGLGRQPSRCGVRLLILGTARFQVVSRIGKADTEKAIVAFLASLGWRSQRGPAHYLDTLLAMFDCLVIGAGPGGAAAAYHLARLGRSVLLLEKEALPREKPCGGGVSPEVAQWFDFDFGPVINARVHRFRFTFEGADPVEAESDTREPLWLVRRDAFDAFLVAQARGQGAELKAGCPVQSLRFEDSAWTVETPEGPQRGRYLVAADGAKGSMAKALGFTHRRFRIAGAIEAECAIPAPDGFPLCLDFGTVGSGYLWNFPKADGQSFGIGVMRGRQNRDLRSLLREYTATFGADLDACAVAAHPIVLWDGDQDLHTQQAVLAGEAACIVDPFTAEGIRPSLLTGVRAAEAIHRALQGVDRALEGYTAAIQREIGTEMAWARRLAAVFFNLPAMGYRLGVKHPGAPQRMAKLLCGELRYADVAQRALTRLSGGLF
jgi:geranylgeranyl reductase family protein